MQYDYMNAYFDFFEGEGNGFKVARKIVREYEDYPIVAWRLMFLEILEQLNEYDGDVDFESDLNVDDESEQGKKKNYKKSKNLEPTITCELENNDTISIETANIKSVYIKFYIIDVEILFSRTPFLKENTEEFSYVKPFHVIE